MTAMMTLDQVKAIAPSVFASAPASSVSKRFTYIPTAEVLTSLIKQGWGVRTASQSKCREPGGVPFVKHVLRLRHGDAPKIKDECFLEAVLMNAHNGTSSYRLNAGIYRMWCENGAICADGTIEEVVIKHTGEVIAEVTASLTALLTNGQKAISVVRKWKSITLTEKQELAFATAAHTLRFKDPADAPVKALDLLGRRRPQDKARDLWTVFNVVQENSIKGGLKGQITDKRNRIVAATTRPIKAVGKDVRLNRALWELGEITAKRAA